MLRNLVLTALLLSSFAHAEGKFCPLSQTGQEQLIDKNLLVFISFSMPEQSLKQLAEQVKEADGVLVLRGLHNNSYKQTLQRIHQVTKDSQSGFAIDPRLFDEFEVETVPTFVLKNPGGQFNKVVGNVSLDYVMSIFSKGK